MSEFAKPSSLPHWRRVLKALSGVVAGLLGIILILYFDTVLNGQHPQAGLAGESVNYGLLFMTGLLTGFHCVGMCGALVVSYATKGAQAGKKSYPGHAWYGFGKTLSYTLIGALFGWLGSIIAFTPYLRGVVGISAGLFLLVFGLGMLNVLAGLNRFRIRTPGAMMRFIGVQMRRHNHPFAIGLLNGLMVICGPLQAMYIMAAGSGDPLQGARLLLVFGLGTLPVMLGFGMLTSLVSRSVTPRLLKLSGVIVMALGVVMLNRGLVLTGSGYDALSLAVRAQSAWSWLRFIPLPTPESGHHESHQHIIETHIDNETAAPNQFVVRKGVPVKWVVHGGSSPPSCSNEIVIPKLGLKIPIHEGQQTIEFTADQAGPIAWSCGMGMISGTFDVVDEANTPDQDTDSAH